MPVHHADLAGDLADGVAVRRCRSDQGMPGDRTGAIDHLDRPAEVAPHVLGHQARALVIEVG